MSTNQVNFKNEMPLSLKLVQTVLDGAQGMREEEKNEVISIFNKCDEYKTDKNGNRTKGQDHKLDKEEINNFFSKIAAELQIIFEHVKSSIEDGSLKYTVKQNDTLYSIAKNALELEGATADGEAIQERVQSIKEMNGIEDETKLQIGQELVVHKK